MNLPLYYLLVLFIFVIIPIGIIIFIYWLLRKYNKAKVAKQIAPLLLLLYLFIPIYLIFEDTFYSKNDVKKELLKFDIFLNDDFELLENKSGGFKDYYHTFRLKISDKDFQKLTSFIETNEFQEKIILRESSDLRKDYSIYIDKTDNILYYEYFEN